MDPRRAAVVVAGLSLLGQSGISSADPVRHEHAAREHVVVRIADDGVEPAVRMAAPDEAVVWINYARSTVRITLGREATTRVHCREPSHFRTNQDGRLVAEIVDRFESASLCLLAPGTYEYVVEELDSAARPMQTVPGGKSFQGRLVVQRAGSAPVGAADLRMLARYHRSWAEIDREIAELREELAALHEAERSGTTASEYRERAGEARADAADHERLARAIEAWLDGDRATAAEGGERP